MLKNLPTNAGDAGLIPGLGRFLGVGNANPLQFYCLGNPVGEEPGRLQSMGSRRVRYEYACISQFISHGKLIYILYTYRI